MSLALWACMAGDDVICAWDAHSFKELARFELGRQQSAALGVRRMVIDDARSLIYTACTYADIVAVLDMQSGRWLESIPVGAAPTGMALWNGELYVCCSESESLWRVELDTLKAVGCTALPGFPLTCELGRDELLLCCMSLPTLHRIAPGLTMLSALELNNPPMHASAVGEQNLLVTLLPQLPGGAGMLALLDGFSGEELMSWPMGAMPGLVRVSPDGSKAMAADMGGCTLIVLDCKLFTSREAPTGSMPDDIVWLPSSEGAFVSCMLDDSILFIDRCGKGRDGIKTGREPRGLALSEY